MVNKCDSYGSNNTSVQTSCIQTAIDDCRAAAATGQTAIVILPRGTFHTGSLAIPSYTTLRLSAQTSLLGSANPADYPLVGPLEGYGSPRDCCCNDWLKYNCSDVAGQPPTYTHRHRALLTTTPGAVQVAVEGAGVKSSIVDGNGWPWWGRFVNGGLIAGRPHLVEPMYVTDFRIEGVWLKDSPFWTLHPYACTDVVIRDLHITADPVHGHNTDGIDPDSCSNVLVERCYVSVGDDAVAIKSGIDAAGREFGRPSKDMLFRDCIFATKHVSIGSEESGGVSNITMEDCTLGAVGELSSSEGFNPGVHLKAERGRGGYIQDVTLQRLSFVGPLSQPFFISMFYSDARNRTNVTATPRFANIALKDIMVSNATGQEVQGAKWEQTKSGWAGALVGLPEAPIQNLSLSNVSVILGPHIKVNHSAVAWKCSNVASGMAERVTPPLPTGCFE